MSRCCASSALRASYGDARALHGVSLELKDGRDAGADRRQRRGQKHAAEGDLRARRRRSRAASCSRVRTSPTALPIRIVQARRGAGSGGAAVISVALGRGKSYPRRARRSGRDRGAWRASTAIFPVLKERRRQPATAMSGGQQQMCAIGRALMSNPELILFDELSLGLSRRPSSITSTKCCRASPARGMPALFSSSRTSVARSRRRPGSFVCRRAMFRSKAPRPPTPAQSHYARLFRDLRHDLDQRDRARRAGRRPLCVVRRRSVADLRGHAAGQHRAWRSSSSPPPISPGRSSA